MIDETEVKARAIEFIASHDINGGYAKKYYKSILKSLIDDRSCLGTVHVLAQVANDLHAELSKEQLEKGLTAMRNNIRKACKANGWEYLTIKQVKRRHSSYGYMLAPAGKRRVVASKGEKTLQERVQDLVNKYGINATEDAVLHCI